MAPKREQLNIRLPADWFEVLETAGYVHGESVPEYVRAVLEQHVGQLRVDPDVQAILRRRNERRAIDAGKVTRLDRRRGESDL